MKAKQALASNGLIRDKIQQKFGENCIPGLLRVLVQNQDTSDIERLDFFGQQK